MRKTRRRNRREGGEAGRKEWWERNGRKEWEETQRSRGKERRNGAVEEAGRKEGLRRQ